MTGSRANVSLAVPGTLRMGRPPFVQGLPGLLPISVAFLVAAVVLLAVGTVLFGLATLRVAAVSMAAALLVESVFHLFSGRPRRWSESHALVIGALFACTVPAMTPWYIVLAGSAGCVLIGEALLGGAGNYLWHPVALGRILVQLLSPDDTGPLPVLAPGWLFWGDLSRAQLQPPLASWSSHPVPGGVQAWLVTPPIEHLRHAVPINTGAAPVEALADLVRDTLPPWPETLSGVAGGPIGEAAAAGVIVAGLVLLWRGMLRSHLVFGGITAAVLVAAVLPVTFVDPQGRTIQDWLPIAGLWQGWPVGVAYVLYQLTAGDLLFVLLVLAPEPSTSPLTSRGHLVFGLLIGAVAIALRVLVGVPAAAYWALLLANTSVPVIDRMTRRRVLGT